MFRKLKIILVLILIILIFLLSLPLPVSQNLKAKLIDISSPLLKVSSCLAQKISSIKSWTQEIFKTAKENKRLRKETIQLSSQLNQLNEFRLENQRLQKLLDLKNSLPYDTIACRVIGRDAGNWFRTLIIDKGSKTRISPDLPVVAAGGVIGRVISCGQSTATVLLVTDTNSSIGGMIQDTRVVGLVEGQGTGECIFNFVSKEADLPVGATVVTSGLGTIFPKGLVIGKVTEVRMDSQSLYKIARLKLAVDINRVEEVLVLKKPTLASNQLPPRGYKRSEGLGPEG